MLSIMLSINAVNSLIIKKAIDFAPIKYKKYRLILNLSDMPKVVRLYAQIYQF